MIGTPVRNLIRESKSRRCIGDPPASNGMTLDQNPQEPKKGAITT